MFTAYNNIAAGKKVACFRHPFTFRSNIHFRGQWVLLYIDTLHVFCTLYKKRKRNMRNRAKINIATSSTWQMGHKINFKNNFYKSDLRPY